MQTYIRYTTKGLFYIRAYEKPYLLKTLSDGKCIFGPYISHGVASCLPSLIYRQALYNAYATQNLIDLYSAWQGKLQAEWFSFNPIKRMTFVSIFF